VNASNANELDSAFAQLVDRHVGGLVVPQNSFFINQRDRIAELAVRSVEAGLYAVWERLSDGRLFVFNSLQNWLSEFRIYRRDEKGKIVKQNDHLMDATRYLVMSGLQVACREPREEDDDNRQWIDSTRNEYTGY
jgi:hypothetical protein